MNTSYHNVDALEGWDELCWLLDGQNVPSGYEAQNFFHQQDVDGIQAGHTLFPHYTDNVHGTSNISTFNVDYTLQQCQIYPGASNTFPLPGLRNSTAAEWRPDIFDKVPACLDPPDTRSLQQQAPRFEGDLYTAPYSKGEGVERAGWCGFCSTWHKLKDSAYWYHMHYTHGVSCLTGRQLVGPQKMQWNYQFNGWQPLCPRCNTWLTLGRGDKAAKTAYYRHAYQCQVRTIPQSERTGGVRKSRSPRRLVSNDNSQVPGRYPCQ